MKRTYLVLVITLLVIGFAAVATNLVINGTINFGFNPDDFNKGVVFTYTNTMHGEATILDAGKSITFKTTKLDTVGQQAIMDFDVANKSSQYDASVTINCGLEDEYESYSDYIDIEQNLKSPFDIESGATESGRLTITLKKAYNESLTKDINMVCKLEATPKERDTEGKYEPLEHEYEEILLQGADPVLDTTTEAMSIATTTNKKLIPVIINNEGKVKRADTTEEWYDYETKNWANAVILNDNVAEPSVGSEIKEDQIESYFVWIPKYRYKLWNVDGETKTEPFAIEIEFGTEDTEDNDNECIAPNKSGETGHCANGMWMTHPAFTSFEVNGFWIGKFETGYRGATSKEQAVTDEENSSKVIVKPNAYSWRQMTNKNIFNSLLKYAPNLDSHMMKNTEWGAVAYLSHSEYGINDEVAQNTEPNYITGYANTDSGMVAYPSSVGFRASTTGNITGIYDMSGGAWDRVAAYRDKENVNEKIGASAFTKQELAKIEDKYFDVYAKDTINTSFENRILGDATGEMGPFTDHRSKWYKDHAYFVEEIGPWFDRGGLYSDVTGGVGQFHFTRHSGGANVDYGSRLILSPQ